MSIFLNAYPLSIPDSEMNICCIPYSKETLDHLRQTYDENHFFKRHGDKILIVSKDTNFPVKGEIKSIRLNENISLFLSLVRDSLIRFLKQHKRYILSYNPISFTGKNDSSIFVEEMQPFSIVPKYSFHTRIINKKPCLIIDTSTCLTVKENCLFFKRNGLDLIGRAVFSTSAEPHDKTSGIVQDVESETAAIKNKYGEVNKVSLSSISLRPDRENLDFFLNKTLGNRCQIVQDKIRRHISSFNSGIKKQEEIDLIANYFIKNKITLINGFNTEMHSAKNIENYCKELPRPSFIFDDNRQANSTEKGLKDFGPYTRRTFDKNNPHICVICQEKHKGRIEQFVNKLLRGISNTDYFNTGFERKFSIGSSKVSIFTLQDISVDNYKTTIKKALNEQRESDKWTWSLGLVEICDSFKDLPPEFNPYYISKSLFLLHQIPSQEFTIELIDQSDVSLSYSLNNIALACYAKMGGIPWLLKSSPTIAHELVIGIGSANIGTTNNRENRVMGITTIFSGDGNYILSSTSPVVPPDEYCEKLTKLLIEKIRSIAGRMNWQPSDTIRLIFHCQVKKFNEQEIEAVKSLINSLTDYKIEYAFLKISTDHGLQMFDTSTENQTKGPLAPQRGQSYQLSDHEMLLYLTGQRQLRRKTDGHPRGLILELQRASTFKDIIYLSSQLYNFSAHSWRSFFPGSLPVTISYSNLIAQNLGWLNTMPDWNDTVVVDAKIGQSQWFL